MVKSKPSQSSHEYILMVNKLNKTNVWNVWYTQYSRDPSKPQLITEKCVSTNCDIPKFVDQMNATLFVKIDGAVDFNFKESDDGKSGHFLIINIDGRPMGCFAFEDEDISEEVRHKTFLFHLLTVCLTLVQLFGQNEAIV